MISLILLHNTSAVVDFK